MSARFQLEPWPLEPLYLMQVRRGVSACAMTASVLGRNIPARLVTYLSPGRKAFEAVPSQAGANYLSLDRY
jgi:hypothetical protein